MLHMIRSSATCLLNSIDTTLSHNGDGGLQHLRKAHKVMPAYCSTTPTVVTGRRQRSSCSGAAHSAACMSSHSAGVAYFELCGAAAGAWQPDTYLHAALPAVLPAMLCCCTGCLQVNLWRVCEAVLRLTRPLVKDNVRLINCINKDMPPVKGDGARLMQVNHTSLPHALNIAFAYLLCVGMCLLPWIVSLYSNCADVCNSIGRRCAHACMNWAPCTLHICLAFRSLAEQHCSPASHTSCCTTTH
eukprot:GHRQ01021147.1.p1 GENE.GHRQ01021147.1~~GHRQ01021147.1.p1  ORF type:complete len:244 (-),score=43.68 GHRQ01021147.1:335-1066(-)